MLIAIPLSILSSKQHVRSIDYDFGKSVANGIDVSEHNKDIDWHKVSKSVDFAFIRIGYRGYGTGEIYEDKLASRNFRAANKAGIPVGAYFYSQATNEKEAVEEAKFAIKHLRHYDIQLPVIIDFEYAADENGNRTGRLYEAHNSRDDNAKLINAFCKTIEQAGYTSGVYASSSVYFGSINTKKLTSTALLWVADYNDEVSYDVRYDVWQYSKTGKCDGVSSEAVDLDYWYTE